MPPLLAPQRPHGIEARRPATRDRLPPRTAELYDDFRQCPRCSRVYWRGSHYRRMAQWIEDLTRARA
jgi:hypothetical protein